MAWKIYRKIEEGRSRIKCYACTESVNLDELLLLTITITEK